MADIAPGSQVTVKVVKQPTSAAATKTVVRLLSKDPGIAKRNKTIKKNRNASPKFSPRGGRWRVWESRQPKVRLVHGRPGEQGTITAGVQELRDLASVERFVEVSPA